MTTSVQSAPAEKPESCLARHPIQDAAEGILSAMAAEKAVVEARKQCPSTTVVVAACPRLK